MRTAVRSALAGLVLVATAEAKAQQASHTFTVTPTVGTIRWDEASALANKQADETGAFTKSVMTPTIGLNASYSLFGGLGIGFYFDAARPTTRGDYFPAVLFTRGGRVDLLTVSQRVTALMYGAEAQWKFDLTKLQPYVAAGFGAVTINQDPQQSNGNSAFSKTSFELGGGLGWKFASGGVLKLDVRDYVFSDWDRNKLYPTSKAFQNTVAANVTPPAEKSSVHNLRFALGFSFVPQRPGDTGTEGRE